MTDYIVCYTGPQDVLIDTGKGHLPGAIITTNLDATSGACTMYDYTGAGPPTGPQIFNVLVTNSAPMTCYFNDRFAPRFHDGLWLHLSDHCYAMIWYHIPTVP
jgi:hypothetical protein